MTVDKIYCMSSFLMYRTIADENTCFAENVLPKKFQIASPTYPVTNSAELEAAIEEQMVHWTKNGKVALALSGGIDSAILAKYMPKGSMAYTFQCVVPGVEVTSEVAQAKKYAEECGLQHKVVPIYWEDMETLSKVLMKAKGEPIHSIEVQIYKAALQAKEDGFDGIILGESSDVNYGGLSGLMSKDWKFGEFVDRYTFLHPYKVLKESTLVLEPYLSHEKNGCIDPHNFVNDIFKPAALESYYSPCQLADINCLLPYANTFLNAPLDYARVRAGENKYIVRELFSKLYDGYEIPPKLPMPRATNEWFKDWAGPTRPEFFENCVGNLTGDQKWLVYALEQFLNMIEVGKDER